MTLAEIKAAVESGQRVCWKNPGHQVIKDSLKQWLIECVKTKLCRGLTCGDGKTLNGKPADFHIEKEGV